MRYEQHWKTKGLTYFTTFLVLLAFWGWDYQNLLEAQAQTPVWSSETGQVSTSTTAQESVLVSQDTNVSPTPIPALELTTEAHRVVFEVFGGDYEKAILLLKGNEKCQGENPSLNQNAVNDNTVWGGIGRDWGLFQINDVFHPVFELNLHKDLEANVRYAKRMFENDGKTFSKRWAAGKCLASKGYDI